MTVLIAEKDADLLNRMQTVLERAGYSCLSVLTPGEAEARQNLQNIRLAILHAGLPWSLWHPFVRALEIARVPVLFTGCHQDNRHHLRTIYHANCDVLARPFSLRQIVAKAETLIRTSAAGVLFGNLCINLEQKTALVSGKPLRLTSQEYALLAAFAHSPDIALSRQELLKTAWGYLAAGRTRTVDVHVQRLRRKLGGHRIETVYKKGYRLRTAW
jgi:DNA-binding response OmpR family regulator